MKLEKLKSICDGATPGDWDHAHIFDGQEVIRAFHGTNVYNVGLLKYETDGRFVVAARAMMPRLIELALAALKVQELFNTACEHDVLRAAEKHYDRCLANLEEK